MRLAPCALQASRRVGPEPSKNVFVPSVASRLSHQHSFRPPSTFKALMIFVVALFGLSAQALAPAPQRLATFDPLVIAAPNPQRSPTVASSAALAMAALALPQDALAKGGECVAR